MLSIKECCNCCGRSSEDGVSQNSIHDRWHPGQICKVDLDDSDQHAVFGNFFQVHR